MDTSKTPLQGRKTRRMQNLQKEELVSLLQKKKERNARAQEVVEKMLENVDQAEFMSMLIHINQCHMEDVFNERSILKICGWPLCQNTLNNVPTQQYRISLTKDSVNLEKQSQDILTAWLSAECNIQKNVSSIDQINTELPDTSVILKPLSKLIFDEKLEDIVSLLKTLKTNPNVKKIYLWATIKNIRHPFYISFLAHIANSIVTVHNTEMLSIVTQTCENTSIRMYKYEIGSNGVFSLQEVTHEKNIDKTVPWLQDPNLLSTFKIGNLSKPEEDARKHVQMAYEKVKHCNNSIETPYFDEDDEDPDDDLDI